MPNPQVKNLSATRRFTVASVLLLSATFCSFATAELAGRIDVRKVTVGGEIGRRIDVTVENNLLKIDVDNDFLKPFRDRSKKDGGYIGLGKLIDSLVRLAAHTNNERLVKQKEYVVAETIKTQEADGYIGLFVPKKRMWALWDIHEMTYIVNGLVADYNLFDKRSSLEAAVKLMDYIVTRWSAEPDGMAKTPLTVFMAVTGLEETLLMLHEATGDERYLDFCVQFRRLPEWDTGIVIGRWGPIAGHAYAYMHRCLAQLRLHQVRPDARLLRQTRNTLDFLTKRDGLLINGVCSQHECWHDSQDGTSGLGETCSTAYLIRVLDELIRMEKESLYGDLMERSIYNGLFAAQSPDGRQMRYYVPFESPRVYFDRDTYCCPCNYRRIVAELPAMIYYRMDRGLAVNLYAGSEAEIELEEGITVKVRQETDYPNSGEVTLHLTPSATATFPVRLRIPRWCENATIAINGQPIESAADGGLFLPIERQWKKGDRIELKMPMPWRLVRGRKAQAGRVAIMRGPQLFCLNLAKNEAVAKADLRQILIDPETVEGPFADDTVRPNGLACKVKASGEIGFSVGGDNSLELLLTEFPDPDGVATYFKVRRTDAVGVEDELAFAD